jgi:hypothetical protein
MPRRGIRGSWSRGSRAWLAVGVLAGALLWWLVLRGIGGERVSPPAARSDAPAVGAAVVDVGTPGVDRAVLVGEHSAARSNVLVCDAPAAPFVVVPEHVVVVVGGRTVRPDGARLFVRERHLCIPIDWPLDGTPTDLAPGADDVVEVRVPGYVPSFVRGDVVRWHGSSASGGEVPLTLLPAGTLAVELLHAPAELFDALPVACWGSGVGSRPPEAIVHHDGSWTAAPSFDVAVREPSFVVDGLPVGARLEVRIGLVGGTPLTAPIEVVVPQRVLVDLSPARLLRIVCDREVDGMVVVQDARGRSASADVVRGRGVVRLPDKNLADCLEHGLRVHAWGDGWTTAVLGVPAGATEARLAVRDRATLRLRLDTAKDVEAYWCRSSHVIALDDPRSTIVVRRSRRGRRCPSSGSSGTGPGSADSSPATKCCCGARTSACMPRYPCPTTRSRGRTCTTSCSPACRDDTSKAASPSSSACARCTAAVRVPRVTCSSSGRWRTGARGSCPASCSTSSSVASAPTPTNASGGFVLRSRADTC